MKKLVVVADDFGLTEGVNRGIIKGYQKGIVTEISLMLNSPATDHALSLLKKHKIQNVGIHLLLKGISNNNKSMKRDDYIAFFKTHSYADVEKLASVELQLFTKRVGRKPTHIIPQYGIHGNLKLLDYLIKYAKNNKIPMRIPRSVLTGGNVVDENYAAEIMMKRENVKTTDYLFAHIEGFDLDAIKKQFLEELKTVKNGQSAEIITHPGYFDENLLNISSLNYERARDLSMVLEKEFKAQIVTRGFTLSHYSDVSI